MLKLIQARAKILKKLTDAIKHGLTMEDVRQILTIKAYLKGNQKR